MIEIYTDGSCLKNPGGKGGWAAIILNKDQKQIICGNEFKTTSNRMEMRAILGALRWSNENYVKGRIKIYSDSLLVVKCFNKIWRKNKNRDLWEDIERERKGLDVKIFWLQGHSGNRYNEEVDEIALSAAYRASKKGEPCKRAVKYTESEDIQDFFSF